MAVDMFLKLGGIEGESQDHKHKGEIDILSFSWGATQVGAHAGGGGGGAGKVNVHDFSFVHKIDKASPQIMMHACTGAHIKDALLSVRKAGGEQQDYLTIKLSDVLVSSYQAGGNSQGDEIPLEQVSLNFTKIDMEYREQDPATGKVGGSFFSACGDERSAPPPEKPPRGPTRAQ